MPLSFFCANIVLLLNVDLCRPGGACTQQLEDKNAAGLSLCMLVL